MTRMNRKGFTLIELLIVVVIIGILAAIAIPRFGETRQRAYTSAMQSDLNQVRTAQEMFYQDNAFSYASSIGDLEGQYFTGTDGVNITIVSGDSDGWSATADHDASAVTCEYDSAVGEIICGA